MLTPSSRIVFFLLVCFLCFASLAAEPAPQAPTGRPAVPAAAQTSAQDQKLGLTTGGPGGWGFYPAARRDPALPRVLLIGDSICNGYRGVVARELKGQATVDVWLTPAAESDPGLFGDLEKVLAQGPYAVVHFNIGLHGWQKGRIPEGQYEPLMRRYVEVLKRQAPQAKLVWGSTTPITVKGHPTDLDPTDNPTIVARNASAAKIMQEAGIAIDDLYSLVVEKRQLAAGDRYHWKSPGCELMGKQVAAIVAKDLPATVVPARPVSLLPWPEKVEWQDGSMTLDGHTMVVIDGSPEAQAEAETLVLMLRPATGLPLQIVPRRSNDGGAIVLILDPRRKADLGDEGYALEIGLDSIQISAATPAGLFYGGQTLRQLLSPAIYAGTRQEGVAWNVPACRIKDKPRMAWRGFMLDYSRHFFGVDYTKHLLDAMAMHKLNVFHMHLTDDDGWRIEIKKYPKLTEIGAWRGTQCPIPNTRGGQFERYGGFLTQEQIREIVAYAARLHINVLPEIDLPGHGWALCTAYPETLPGRPNNSECTHGFKNNAISPAREENYRMVDDIVGEVAALFPFGYLHIGGDEVNYALWKDDPAIQALVEREKLGGLEGAQFYFTRRLEAILAKHGKQMVGWNELFDPRLDKTTTIMAWIGENSGSDAARAGYPAIQAYGPRTYFNIPYRGHCDEPKGHHAFAPFGVEETYSYDPHASKTPLAPEALSRIFGVHGCLWTEFVTPYKAASGWLDLTREQNADYQIFPRLCALAEIGWTPQAQRHYADFAQRLNPTHLVRMETAGIIFRVPPPRARARDGMVEVEPPYASAEIRYTLDGSDPFNSPTAIRWDGQPLKCPPKTFRARTKFGQAFSPLCTAKEE